MLNMFLLKPFKQEHFEKPQTIMAGFDTLILIPNFDPIMAGFDTLFRFEQKTILVEAKQFCFNFFWVLFT